MYCLEGIKCLDSKSAQIPILVHGGEGFPNPSE